MKHKNDFYFTVSGEEFNKMINNADESFLKTPLWKNFRNRIIE
jgi:hypothetical protein